MRPRPVPFLILLCVFTLIQVSGAQITEGAISFETQTHFDWTAYEKETLNPELEKIEQSEMPEAEKARQKENAVNMYNSGRKLMERLTGTVESVEFVFSNGVASAERSLNGVREDEFTRYIFDSMRTTRYYFDPGGILKNFTMGPGSGSSAINLKYFVRIDSFDTRDILGFHCVKYYVGYSNLANESLEPNLFQYEMYVTDAISLPLYLIDPVFTEKIFDGCALEIRHIDPNSHSSYSTVSATAFNRQADISRLDIPARFRH